MIFKIDPPGTDYTRVTLDVPHDQLTDVIHAVTTINRTALDRAAGRRTAQRRSESSWASRRLQAQEDAPVSVSVGAADFLAVVRAHAEHAPTALPEDLGPDCGERGDAR